MGFRTQFVRALCTLLICCVASAQESILSCDPDATLAPSEINSTAGPESQPKLARRVRMEPFGCRRQYFHRDQVLNVDSFHKRDGERLRQVVSGTPEALTSLNRYQSNILSARAAAYVGTVGLVAALVSSFLNTSDPTQSSLRQILSVGGLILAGGSFAFSFAVLRTNESNLKDAVQYYNSANPNTPIQLQFSTSVLF